MNPFDSHLDDYNPFEDSPQFVDNYQAPAAAPQIEIPAPRDPETPQAQISETELARMEAELAARERELEQQERLAENNGGTRPKNFPPFFKLLAYYPSTDLSPDIQPLNRWIFGIFMLAFITYGLNWIGSLCVFKAGECVSSVGALIVLSTIYIVFMMPLAFRYSFYVFYQAAKDGKAMLFFCFLASYAIFGCIMLSHLLGTNGGGSIGYITMIRLYTYKHYIIGTISLVVSLLYTACVLLIVYTWHKAYKYYKQKGLHKRALTEASAVAMDYARQNPDVVINTVAENPDLLTNLNPQSSV